MLPLASGSVNFMGREGPSSVQSLETLGAIATMDEQPRPFR